MSITDFFYLTILFFEYPIKVGSFSHAQLVVYFAIIKITFRW